MTNHRMIQTVGVAGGFLMITELLGMAIASADSDPAPTDTLSLVPVGPENIGETYSPIPQIFEISTGTQEFDVDAPGTVGNLTVGSVEAEVTYTDFLGVTNSLDVVASDLTAAADDPQPGSVYDTTVFGNTGYENVLTDVATVGAATPSITDTIDTPYGDYTASIALHQLGFYWHDFVAISAAATTDGLSTSSADGLTGIVADLGSLF